MKNFGDSIALLKTIKKKEMEKEKKSEDQR